MTAEGLGEQLTGEVLGVYFADRERGFGVVEIQRDDDGPGTRCSGPLAELVEGQRVTLTGRWREHPRYGTTFEAVAYERVAPTTAAGLRAFLAEDRFDAVDPAARERVVTVFGDAAGLVIERQPERLVGEAGVASADADELHRAWTTGRALAALIRLVEPVAWPMTMVRAAHDHVGDGVVAAARDDPYGLLAVPGIGFAQIDALGAHLGVPRDDPRRLRAGARASVDLARRRQGHTHLRRGDAEQATARLLGADRLVAADALTAALDAGSLECRVVAGEEVVATPAAFAAEQQVADGLARLVAGVGAARAHPPVLDDELTPTQRQAVAGTLAGAVTVLTGGPGTGKTRTVRAIVRAAEAAGLDVALAAPTGRAAKRLEEVVGRPASTLHRLLEARPTGDGGFRFRYGAAERLPHELVIVDEVSMCDTWLTAQVLAALADGTRLVLVGDADQLPSVGPGDVLGDLIDSGVVPVFRLVELHRQAAGSRIVRLANEVLAGEVGLLGASDGDVFMAQESRRTAIVPRVVRAVAERAPARFDVDVDQVQVLAPVYRGPAGIDALNGALKLALNPAEGRPAVGGLQVGDRVLQTRNVAELDVANGDVGTVVDLDRRAGTLRVAFPRGEVTYARDQVRDLSLAWAMSVHKAQGGEWPVVVLVLDGSHRGMLWRQLLYTAITRAERALIVVGQAELLRAAAARSRPVERRTGLAWRLRTALADDPAVSR